MSAVIEEKPLLKLDLGAGKNKKEGFTGVDAISFPGIDVVADLREKWPWADSSVAEAHCSHFLEHLERLERIHFVNELYRVLVPGGTCSVIVPHWASNRAYGDMTHCWPPVSEMWFYYLDKNWRMANAPHDDIEHNPRGYNCDFGATWGYSLHQHLTTRSQDYVQHAMSFWKEACQDTIATLTSRKPK
jgi:SAM-dependent methyltransferase